MSGKLSCTVLRRGKESNLFSLVDFTSPQYIQRLLNQNVKISMDGKCRAIDNIFTERLWRSVKYEEVYIHNYANPREARVGIGTYLKHYNKARPHQSLHYKTPFEVYHNKV